MGIGFVVYFLVYGCGCELLVCKFLVLVLVFLLFGNIMVRIIVVNFVVVIGDINMLLS